MRNSLVPSYPQMGNDCVRMVGKLEVGQKRASGKRHGQPVVYTQYRMRELLRFFWNATRGHRLAPWRSPYLRWRMETYSGLKMDKIGFVEFWGFMVRERKQLRRFLKWTAEMDNYARPKPKNP